MKFLILDVYPSDDWRLVKDTAGGYGTGNDFGNSLVSKLINIFVSKMISMPPMYALYVYSILKKRGQEVEYSRNSKDEEKIRNADFIIMPSSIIAHETEKENLESLSMKNKKIFVIGIFASTLKKKYQYENSYIVPGEPENFFQQVDLDKKNLDKFFINHTDLKINNNIVNDLDSLPYPDWEYYTKKFPLKNNFLGFNSRTAIPILASRGCPYSCFNYCTYPLQQGRKVRYRSVTNIVNEVKFWIKKLKTNKFIFRDPVFSINRKFTVDLCNEIINQNLKIEFLIETHLKNLDDQ